MDLELLVKMLSAFVNCDSHVSNPAGQAQMAELFVNYGSKRGVEFEMTPGSKVTYVSSRGIEEFTTGNHIVGRLGSGTGTAALLLGHYDTVFPLSSGFSDFRRLSANVARGPGVIDMKGGLVVMLTVIDALRSAGFFDSHCAEILVVSDEEVGSPSSRKLIEKTARRAERVYCFEPPLEKDVYVSRRKGSARATIEVTGKSAHAGRHPDEGANAIVSLADIILRATALSRPNDGRQVNVGTIAGGVARNQVPASAICEIDLRYSTTEAEAELRSGLEEILANTSVEGTSARIVDYLGRPPKPNSPEMEAALRAVHDACFPRRAVDFRDTGGSCDGNFTAALGIPTFDTLGAYGSGIHTSSEEIFLPSLLEQTRIASELILSFTR